MQLELGLIRLQEQQGLFSEEDSELQEDHLEGQLEDGLLEDLLLYISLDD